MHRSHPSRGRILFEVLCALTVAASFAGAWMQTGATAMLPAAAVAALYGLVHLFDLRSPKSAEGPVPSQVEVPQRIEFVSVQQAEPEVCVGAVAPTVEVGPTPATDQAVETVEAVEALAPEPKVARKSKAPRKSGGRRASGAKEATIAEVSPAEVADVSQFAPPAELAPPAEAEVTHFEPLEPEPAEFAPPREAEVTHLDLPGPEAQHAEPASLEEAEVAHLAQFEDELGRFPPAEDAAHPQIAPLFEPEPFARMQRRAFGRRGRI